MSRRKVFSAVDGVARLAGVVLLVSISLALASPPASASSSRGIGTPRSTSLTAGNGVPLPASVAGGGDPVGDGNPVNLCQGDITSFGASYSTNIGIWLTTACSPDPGSWPGFLDPIIFSIDVNGDGIGDYAAHLHNPFNPEQPVYATSGPLNGQIVCAIGQLKWDGDKAVSITIRPDCIGSPPSFRVQAHMVWPDTSNPSTCICPYDVAPDFGYSPPAFAPPPAHWYLRNSVGPGWADTVFDFGLRSFSPVVGDWDGNGTQTPGVFDQGTWFLKNYAYGGAPDVAINYGAAGYTPVVGDWDGNGTDTIGVYVGGWWYLRNSNTPGPPDIVVHYGTDGYTPVVGDWDGNGTDTIGVYVGGWWYLRNSNDGGPPVTAFNYGNSGYTPVVGRWTGTTDGVGVVT